MKPEDIVVINSGIRHQVLPEEKGCIICSLSIPHRLIARSIEKEFFLIWCNSVADKSHDFSDLRECLRDLIKHCLVNKKPDLYYQGRVYQILYLLTEHYLITRDDVRYHEQISKNEERIQQILSYIHENYNKAITLNELAEHLYLTNAYLSRFFKRMFGVNFGEYLNSIKLHHAAGDLLYTSKTVTRIAMDNGFANMASFNKSFKAAFDMTPKAYRESAPVRIRDEETMDVQGQKLLEVQLKTYVDTNSRTSNMGGTRRLSVRADALEGRSYRSPWKKLINVGDIACLRDYRIRSELLRLNSSLKFTYARVWNILCNDMHLGRYVSEDTGDYDFSYLDECIDFLLQNNLKPFFQMGYKRSRYKYSEIPDTHSVSIAASFSFSSLKELLGVLEVMFKHLLVRYGQEEMNTWCFEIWHPNVCYYLPDIFYKDGNEVASRQIYREIRKALPQGRIGGAEFSFLMEGDRVCKELLSYKEDGISFDFITCVSFPYKVFREDGQIRRQWQSNRSFMRQELESLRQALVRVGWESLPVWVTEYSFTVEHRNPLNDTRFKGAYILKNMSDIADLADAAGYWLLSDVYSEGSDSNRVLYGGSGIVTKDGINKPAYYALYFLSLLKPMLVARGENFFLTTDGNDTYSLICYNMKELNYLAFIKGENSMTAEDVENAFEDTLPVRLKLSIDHAGRGKYRIKRLKVDKEHGDLLAWIGDNYTQTGLKRMEIWHLKQTCMPMINIYEQRVTQTQILTIDEYIEANNFIYFEIERVH